MSFTDVPLLPCPFCGGSAAFRGDRYRDFQATCESSACEINTDWYVNSADAAAIWNKRVGTQAVNDCAIWIDSTAAEFVRCPNKVFAPGSYTPEQVMAAPQCPSVKGHPGPCRQP